MKYYSSLLVYGALLAGLAFPLAGLAKSPNETILPDDLQIYQHPQYGVTHKAVKKATPKVLPINNDYTGAPGCYLTCVSKNPDYSIYEQDGHSHVKGQMRVKGQYIDGHCIPHGYQDKDARNDETLKGLCERNFPKQCVNGSCHIHTQTGHWFH